FPSPTLFRSHRLTSGELVAIGDDDSVFVVAQAHSRHLRQVGLPVLRDLAADLDEAVAATAPRRFVQLDVEAQVRVVTGHGFDDARQQAGAEGGEGGDAHAGPADGVEAVD